MSQQIIETRNNTHGFYEDNARVTQLLRKIIRSENAKRGPGRQLGDVEVDALDNIVMKISRILTGAQKPEHWEDIGGYARLAENLLTHGHTLGEKFKPAPTETVRNLGPAPTPKTADTDIIARSLAAELNAKLGA